MDGKDSQRKWLKWAQEIQAIAQTGDTYAENEWQRERYRRLLGIAAEIVNSHTDLPVDLVVESFHLQEGYATPKIDVRGAVFDNERILMVKERSDEGWTLPGGWVDVGDTPSGSVEREVFEESGYIVKATRLVGVYDANRVEPLSLYHAFKLIFLCEIIGGEPKVSSETSEVKLFTPLPL